MASSHIVTLNDENFEQQVLNSDVPVLVDFWAEWCGPCRMVAPVLEQLAAHYGGQVRVGKLNVDHHQDLAIQFQVSSIPTFILFKGGRPADRLVGALPKSAFESLIGRNL